MTNQKLKFKKEIFEVRKRLPQGINKILLKELEKYPAKTIENVKMAEDLLLKSLKKNKTSLSVGIKNTNELINKIVKSPKNFLLLLSYCSKPVNCPSKRFSVKCDPCNDSICNKCPFKPIILKAKIIKCKCFIVTHNDLVFTKHLLPRFRKFRNSKEYQPLITTGCYLAINRFYKLAVILGSIGKAYEFINGSCKDLKDYEQAEHGKKIMITKLSQKHWQEIEYILDQVIKKI